MQIPFVVQFVIAIIIIIFWFVVLIIGFVNNLKYNRNLLKIFKYLENNQPEKFKELGQPGILKYSNPLFLRNMFKILKFLKELNNWYCQAKCVWENSNHTYLPSFPLVDIRLF